MTTAEDARSGGQWITFIPKNASINVQFIEEPENWVRYLEHYDQTRRRSFPCDGEVNCPGCVPGGRKSYRYLANVVDLDGDKVIALLIPRDLANRLVVWYERYGTLTDRGFELFRTGEGLHTVDGLHAQAQERKRTEKYLPLDLQKVLRSSHEEMASQHASSEVGLCRSGIRQPWLFRSCSRFPRRHRGRG